MTRKTQFISLADLRNGMIANFEREVTKADDLAYEEGSVVI